jgi:hypothetical protein
MFCCEAGAGAISIANWLTHLQKFSDGYRYTIYVKTKLSQPQKYWLLLYRYSEWLLYIYPWWVLIYQREEISKKELHHFCGAGVVKWCCSSSTGSVSDGSGPGSLKAEEDVTFYLIKKMEPSSPFLSNEPSTGSSSDAKPVWRVI